MTLAFALRSDLPVYARCPSCQLVTAPVWQLRAAGTEPVVVGCGYCGHEHRVGRDQAYRTDTLVLHDGCGTIVECPAEAQLVRCHGVPGSEACGDLFAGPGSSARTTGPDEG